MRHARGLGLCLVVAGLLFIPNPGITNDAPVWIIGGGAAPKSSHHSIRMVSEDVTIRLEVGAYTVDAVFEFFNKGKTRTEWVGFPKKGMGAISRGGMGKFLKFETWVNGKKVDFSEQPDLRTDKNLFTRIRNYLVSSDVQWLVKKVTFPPVMPKQPLE